MADKEYDVRLVARRQTAHGVVVSQEQLYVNVDTVLGAQAITTNRDTVYPRSTEVRDRITFQVPRWDARTARLEIRDSQGRVVTSKRMGVESYPTHPGEDRDGFRADWFARSRAGHALPAGRYLARLHFRDAAGNRRVAERNLRVSSRKATRQVWTQTLNAAVAPEYAPPCDSNSCGLFPPCEPVASERFTEGLSFRSSAVCDPEYSLALRTFGVSVPVVPSPDDEYRITATGGPTEVGGPDQGRLENVVASGDGSTSTEWRRVNMTSDAWVNHYQNLVDWTFHTRDGAAYDVATFTVEYAYYAPAS